MDAPDGNGERILHPGISSPTRWTSTVLYSSTPATHPHDTDNYSSTGQHDDIKGISQAFSMSVVKCHATSFTVPWTSVHMSVNETFDATTGSCGRARCLGPCTTMYMQVRQAFKMAAAGRPHAVRSSHMSHPCSTAYLRHSMQPFSAAITQVSCPQGHPCSCRYCRQSMCPPAAANALASSLHGQLHPCKYSRIAM